MRLKNAAYYMAIQIELQLTVCSSISSLYASQQEAQTKANHGLNLTWSVHYTTLHMPAVSSEPL
jgi:hypothetical protein